MSRAHTTVAPIAIFFHSTAVSLCKLGEWWHDKTNTTDYILLYDEFINCPVLKAAIGEVPSNNHRYLLRSVTGEEGGGSGGSREGVIQTL